jgi:hypothetical protein
MSLIRKNFNIEPGRIRLPGPKIEYDESTQVEEITPLKAMELIVACWERYENGRNFYPTKLEKIMRYATDMNEGRWEYRSEGDPISITDGLVTGGRHRLHAVLLSNTTQRFNVKRKVSKNANSSSVSG